MRTVTAITVLKKGVAAVKLSPAADLSTVQPGHYRVELLVFQPGNVKTVFTGSIDVVAGEATPGQ